ncbi:sugar ABC transporter ATP-binding protein [Actinokineospora guangxiensis]|uniref:Sugar ABC transporter ATP-binding protein n=1 Tax=Actinokineospora guangxiensis TaxID=1490288 RepID=A0ABW0EKK1_9PSEU
MAATDVLAATGLTKRFAGVRALEDADIVLRRGRVHALMGENGAGKSTLIKLLSGVHEPDSGVLDRRGARISTVYQEVNLVPTLSVAANLFLGREPRRRGLVDFAAMRRQAAEVLGGLGIDADPRAPLTDFGLGVRQLVAIARAVTTEADVVIMDEPTSALEPREVGTLLDLVRDLAARGVAVLFVSHRLHEVYQVCDDVTVLRDGRVVHTGPLAALERARLVATMLGRELAEARSHVADTDHAAEPGPAALRARGLRSGAAVAGVDIEVGAGEIVGLGGLLGSGRTETVQALAGLRGLDAGVVEAADRPVRAGSPKASIGAGIVLVPEDRKADGIIPHLSVRDNIVLAVLSRVSRFGVLSKARQDAVVRGFMERLSIKASSPNQPVGELSGGNQQKVMLARWLAMSPRVLLLDEPTRGIDVGVKAQVLSLVDELAANGLGIVLVSSDLEELVEGADRVVVLRDGWSVAELRGADVTADGVLAAIADAGERGR